jgi:hypothetical protein
MFGLAAYPTPYLPTGTLPWGALPAGAGIPPYGPGFPVRLIPAPHPTYPSSASARAAELQYVKQVQATRTPLRDAIATRMAEKGGFGVWWRLAGEYRHVAGFARGWAGTGLLLATLGVNTLVTKVLKKRVKETRPFQDDPSIQVVGPVPKDESFPSGHTSSAFAAATIMSALWPQRTAEYFTLAREIGISRIYAGDHYPSDVAAGAKVGMRTGAMMLNVASAL